MLKLHPMTGQPLCSGAGNFEYTGPNRWDYPATFPKRPATPGGTTPPPGGSTPPTTPAAPATAKAGQAQLSPYVPLGVDPKNPLPWGCIW